MASSLSPDVALADLLALERAVFAHRDGQPNPFDDAAADVRVAVLTRVRWHSAYLLYLRSQAWAAKRAAVLERAGRCCERCPAGSGLFPVDLEIHHLTYARLGDEPLEDLQALCRGCHEHAHPRARMAQLTTRR